ncbi:MAG: TonB family protein, partial [Candidatus Binatia bacterium]
MKDNSLGISLLSSLILHGLGILIASLVVHNSHPLREDFVSVSLVELSPERTMQPLADMSRPAATKLAQPQERKSAEKSAVMEFEPPAVPVPMEPIPKPIEAKPAPLAKTDAIAVGQNLRGEASAGDLFGSGDIGVLPGSGTSVGGGGAAASGSGRGSASPGWPTQSAVLRTNREAKPLQTVRAAYPAMALRMGLESDVTLKIEVDPQGNVTKSEITKSGGAGFD